MSRSKLRRIFIVLGEGPDIRQFSHSGLASDLAQDVDIVWVLGQRASSRQLPDSDLKVQLSDIVTTLPTPLKLVTRLAERACNAREERLRGEPRWVNFIDTLRGQNRNTWKRSLDYLLSLPLTHRALVSLEQVLFDHYPIQSAKRRFLALCPDVIVMSNHATPSALSLLWQARRCAVRSIVMQNSWKDAYSRTHVPVSPDVFVVPSQDGADLLTRANFSFNAEVQVRETLHTILLADPSLIMPREAFCELYSLDSDRFIVCVSAAAPNAVHNEPEILLSLLEQLEKDGVQVILRLNPMESNPARWDVLSQYSNLVLQTPDWDYVPDEKWSAPKQKDAAVWASTIAHSILNISVPSTATRDFLLFGKSVVNICFDTLPLVEGESIQRYWDAPFYEPYRNCSQVTPAFSAKDLIKAVRAQLSRSIGNETLPPNEMYSQLLSKSRAVILGETT